jgi:hypothetical protein
MKTNDTVFVLLLIVLVGIGVFMGFQVKNMLDKRPAVNEQVAASERVHFPDQKSDMTSGNEENLPAQDPAENKGVQIRENISSAIFINRPVNLSGWTKKEVFAHRKNAVKNSIFSDANYTPSAEVFGAIEDGKPWIAMNLCRDPQTNALRTDGPSEEDRWIANPSILLALEYPFTRNGMDSRRCTSDVDNLFPQAASYDAEKKEITVEYDSLPFDAVKESNTFYQFNGVNARDLGYKYVSMASTTVPLMFTNPGSNLFTQVVELENFIHLGGSCQVPGGCNNGSPRQPLLEFKQMHTLETDGKSGEIILKLWKEHPSSMTDEADLTEKIIIRKL